MRFYNRHGRLIWQEPRGCAAGYHWPQLSIHRGDPQTVLAQAVRERLGPDAIVTGTRVVGCSPLPDAQVAATTERVGTGTVKAVRADLVIGADGIRSAIRASFYPEEGSPPSNGMVMWRGTTWAEPFLTGESLIVTGDDTRRIVLYPVARHPTGTRVAADLRRAPFV